MVILLLSTLLDFQKTALFEGFFILCFIFWRGGELARPNRGFNQILKDMKESKSFHLILLLSIIFCIFLFLVALLFYVNVYGLTPFFRIFFFILAMSLSFLLFLFLLGILVTLSSLYGFKPKGLLQRLLKVIVSRIIPLVIRLAAITGLDEERLQAKYIELTNTLRKDERDLSPFELLVLVPHCIQLSSCQHRITHEISNCRRCGKCQIKDLLLLQEEYGFIVQVVNGGTQARSMIKKYAPQGIVAVACERDLSSGIMDTFPLPVYGIINLRPQGPCLNTQIPLGKMEEGIRCFLRREAM